MADYDLGTAHGKVVIENDDRGSDRADRNLRQLEATALALSGAMKDLQGSIDSMSAQLGKISAKADDASGKLRNADRDARNIGNSFKDAVSRTMHFSSSLDDVSSAAWRTTQRLQDLLQQMREIAANPLNVAFRSLWGNMANVEDRIGRLTGPFGSIGRMAIMASRSIEGASVAVNSFGRSLKFLKNTSWALTAFAFLGPKISMSTTKLKHFAGALGMVFPSLNKFGGKVLDAAEATGKFGRKMVSDVGIASVKATRGVAQLTIGLLTLRKGLESLHGPGKIALLTIAGLGAGAAGIKFLGTAIMGTLNALKQISGALWIAPGALFSLGLAGGVAALALGNVKKAFEASSLEGEDFDKAIKDLSPEMQKIAKSSKGLMKPLKELASDTVFAGLGDDIKMLSDMYMPSLKAGIMDIGGGLNRVKNGFRDFLLQPDVAKDFVESFGLTRTMLDNVARAIRPLMSGLRNIGMVGMEAFTGMTSGLGSAAARFEAWTAQIRANGDLRKWIDNGVQGIKDLGATIMAISRGFKTIFEAFGSSGENALARMRKATEGWQQSMQKSANGGSLDTVTDALERMGDTSMDTLRTAIEVITDLIKKAAPFVEKLTEAFHERLGDALRVIGTIVGGILKVLGMFDGALGGLVGNSMALAVAFALIGKAWGPLKGGLLMIGGGAQAINGLRGALVNTNKVIAATGAGMNVAGQKMGAFGSAIAAVGTKVPAIASLQTTFVTAAASAGKFGTVVATVRTAMAGLAMAAGALMSAMWPMLAFAAIAGVVSAFGEESRDSADRLAILERKATDTERAVRGFTSAFKEANGVMGQPVIDEQIKQLDELKSTLEDESGKGSSWLSDTWAWTKDTLSWEGISNSDWFGLKDDDTPQNRKNSRENSELDHLGQAAGRAKAEIESLNLTQQQLAEATFGTADAWNNLTTKLKATESGGDDGIAELQKKRDAFLEVQASMDRINASTPGSIQFSNALKTLGDDAASAADKLDALKSALQSMGLMSMQADEAMANYQKELQSIGDAASIAVNAAAGLGVEAMMTGNKLNLTNANSLQLRESLIGLAEAYLASANGGQNAWEAWDQMQPRLQSLADAYNIPIQAIQDLVRTAGAAPDVVEILMKVKGSSESTQDILNVVNELRQVPQNTPITMRVENQAAIDALRALKLTVDDTKGNGEVVITGNAEQLQAAMNYVNGLLATPLPAPTVGQPVVPPPVPPAEGQLVPIDAPKVETPQTPPPAPPLMQNLLPLPAPKVETPQTPAPTPPPPSPPIPAPQVEVPKIPPIPPMTISADPGPAVAAIGEVNGAVDGGIGKFNEFAGAVSGAMNNAMGAINSFVGSAIGALDSAAGGAFNSGAALGSGFASGIQSKVGEVAAAAAALAAAASAPLPNSPAKVGPFSGKGWTPHRGRALAEGFAEGIRDGAPAALLASMGLAQDVSGAIEAIRRGKTEQLMASFGLSDTDAKNFAKTLEDIRSEMKLDEEISANSAYVRRGGITDAELKAENDKRVAERKKQAEREAKKQAQQEAKQKAKEKDEPKDDKPKSEKQLAADAKKTAEQEAADRLKDAIQVIDDGNATQEEIAKSISELEKNGLANTPELKEALRIGANQDSNNLDTLAALETIDRHINSTDDIETQDQLAQLRDSIMSRKGIDKYDPFANASKDIPKDVISVVSNIFSILDQIESTLNGFKTLSTLMVRGFANTDDLTSAVDGFQDVVSGLAGIADTVGGALTTAANVAAAFGQLIPGVGQVAGVISAVTGGIGTVNQVVDLFQQGLKVVGRITGGIVSALAGGKNGALMGNVRTLLDTNDKTIKRWSDDNPMDKRVSSYDLFGNRNGNNYNNTGVENLNIYQGPGTDPYRMVDEAMFSVRAAQLGAYSQ